VVGSVLKTRTYIARKIRSDFRASPARPGPPRSPRGLGTVAVYGSGAWSYPCAREPVPLNALPNARVETVAGLLVTLAADVREAHRERAMNERLREMMSQYDDVVNGPPV
jgi:hypothetical protein